MRSIRCSCLARVLTLASVALALWPASPARSQAAPDVAVEIARLRSRLADNSAQEQRCLAGATQPVWTPALATDLKLLRDRANQAAADSSTAEAQRWRELARKAEILQARAAVSARSGSDLFQGQQMGLDCLDRFAGEREALRASLEVAVADPAAYGDSLRRLREHGAAGLRQDLARLQEQSRALSGRWRQSRTDASDGAQALKAELVRLRRRHTAALEIEAARRGADPALRAAEALIAAAEAWERERAATGRLGGARDDAERRQAGRERDEAARLGRGYWATAEQLLGQRVSVAEPRPTGTGSSEAGGTP
jgi:hypothetical protein